jgi:hypothetical protein
MKHAMFAASLVLVAGSAFGCGGDDGGGGDAAPDNASKAEFCSSFGNLFEGIMSAATGGDESDTIKSLKDGASELADTGTPEDIPDDARHGFEVFVNAIDEIDDNADLSNLDDLGGDVSAADQADVEAFITWAVGECPDALGGLGNLPTELPSDLPTSP